MGEVSEIAEGLMPEVEGAAQKAAPVVKGFFGRIFGGWGWGKTVATTAVVGTAGTALVEGPKVLPMWEGSLTDSANNAGKLAQAGYDTANTTGLINYQAKKGSFFLDALREFKEGHIRQGIADLFGGFTTWITGGFLSLTGMAGDNAAVYGSIAGDAGEAVEQLIGSKKAEKIPALGADDVKSIQQMLKKDSSYQIPFVGGVGSGVKDIIEGGNATNYKGDPNGTMDSTTIAALERFLTSQQLYSGKTDGNEFTPELAQALADYQRANAGDLAISDAGLTSLQQFATRSVASAPIVNAGNRLLASACNNVTDADSSALQQPSSGVKAAPDPDAAKKKSPAPINPK